MPELFDVIVIGSGPAGAHASAVLTERGLHVCMLDGGVTEPPILTNGSSRNFENIRRSDSDQWKMFLGEDCSNIPTGGLEGGLGGGMTGGNRSFSVQGTVENLPLQVTKGIVLQSLAKGGLGTVWGATCAFLSDENLEAMGLPAKEMSKHYDNVTKRIGVSGPETRPGIQPGMPSDHHAQSMLMLAEKKQKTLTDLGVRIQKPHSAVLTRDLGERKATELTDMEYYSDPTKSVYRPQYTIDTMMKRQNFQYLPGVIVKSVEEATTGTTVIGHAFGKPNESNTWQAKRVVVAAGAVNTARILLTSYGLYNVPISFIAKPHAYVACLDRASLGIKGPEKRTALCQLLFVDEKRTTKELDSACAQIYSYRSLLLFRLLSSVPFLPVPAALKLLSFFAPSLVLADVRFPAFAEDGHILELKDDRVHIVCKEGRTRLQQKSLAHIRSALRATGLVPVRTVYMPEASTSHLAGTVPVSDEPGIPLSCNQDGLVRGSETIYVADASMFRCLPALPHTLTIMANAERIGEGIAKTLAS